MTNAMLYPPHHFEAAVVGGQSSDGTIAQSRWPLLSHTEQLPCRCLKEGSTFWSDRSSRKTPQLGLETSGSEPTPGCPSILCCIIGDGGRLVGSSRREIGGLRSKRPHVVPNNGALWTPHDLSSGELDYLFKALSLLHVGEIVGTNKLVSPK